MHSRASQNWQVIAATLSIKYEAKVSAERSVAGRGGGRGSRVLKVEKSLFVSVNVDLVVK